MLYIRNDIFSLHVCGIKLLEMRLLSSFIFSPEFFILSSPVISYHGICRIEYEMGGAVILLELDDFCFGIVFLEIKDISYIGTPEAVD